jgi:hypothetical protein
VRDASSSNFAAFRRFLGGALDVKAYDCIPGRVALPMHAVRFRWPPKPDQVETIRLVLEVVVFRSMALSSVKRDGSPGTTTNLQLGTCSEVII